MINPPDELLADLQSALPPDVGPSSPHPPLANGGHIPREEHTYETADGEDEIGVGGYEMPRSSAERSVSPEVRERERERDRETERQRDRDRDRDRDEKQKARARESLF